MNSQTLHKVLIRNWITKTLTTLAGIGAILFITLEAMHSPNKKPLKEDLVMSHYHYTPTHWAIKKPIEVDLLDTQEKVDLVKADTSIEDHQQAEIGGAVSNRMGRLTVFTKKTLEQYTLTKEKPHEQ